MNTTNSYNDDDAEPGYERTTIAAAFADRERAHDAVHRLHDEGYHETWIGITRSDDASLSASTTAETRVEAENFFARVFGEGDESLHDALVRHGVAEADAISAGQLAPRSAIVTVDGANHPELAAQIMTECAGQMITRGFGATGFQARRPFDDATASTTLGSSRPTSLIGTAAGAYDVASDRTVNDRYADAAVDSVDVDDFRDYGKFRGGATIDDSQRLQLREERLRIEKERLSRGEATIGKTVVEQTHDIDVPTIREELFIERRPVSGDMMVDRAASPIGQDRETIRIPLTEEKINVSKVAVVTEEVVVGKRNVEQTAHVSETTQKEELHVSDVDSTVPAGREPRF